ncbi:MAG: hypothetical protein DRP66_09660 [Planctomycetota bacterium]|nr:MAG: hypothetical protein DRP66_09660 [Planctomycetota bacterium]
MPDKNDNLEQLLGGFLNEAEARRAAADIRLGEEILSEYPAPQPDARLLEEIKTKVSRSLGAAATARRRLYWVRRAVAAAAAVIIIASVLLLWPAPQQSFAGSGDVWDDAAIAGLRAEIDAVLDTMISIETDEYGFDEGADDFAEVELEELEMVATNDDFWKG